MSTVETVRRTAARREWISREAAVLEGGSYLTSERIINRSPIASGSTSQMAEAVARWAQSRAAMSPSNKPDWAKLKSTQAWASCHHEAFAASSPDRVGSTSVNTK